MGCGGRSKQIEIRPEMKWDYISLNDFKSTSCFTPLAYCWLWFSLLLSVTVYGVDIFTAVNLLAFNKWSSEIAPTQLIPFGVSKYIFSVCIILSAVNLVFEHVRAHRVMRRGGVAECYLDNLTVRLESIRVGQSRGWKRFLVFAELTKSKKGAEYIALFSYFSFQSWIRVILCSGPRQVVNALTLVSVYNAKLSASGSTALTTLESFFDKIKALAQEDFQQALILSGMLYTLIIWIFSFLSLLLACLFFVGFLWSYTNTDNGLSGYCERNINKRLMNIVAKKVNKAIEQELKQQRKAELKAAKKAGELPPEERKATLPTFMDEDGEDKLPEMPMLNRNDTMATLPAYTSRPGTPGSIELSALDQKRPMPTRTGTTSTATTSYSTRATLLGAAAELGFNRPASPSPSLPPMDLSNIPPTLPATSNSNRSYGQPPSLSRVPTGGSYGFPHSASPAPYANNGMPSPSFRSPSAAPTEGYGRPRLNPPSRRPTYDDYSSTGRASPAPAAPFSMAGRASPAPTMQSSRTGPQSPRTIGPPGGPGYMTRSVTGPVPRRGPDYAPQRAPGYPPQRNMTAPLQTSQQPYSGGGEQDFYNRPSAPQSPGNTPRAGFGNGRSSDIESQRGPRY